MIEREPTDGHILTRRRETVRTVDRVDIRRQTAMADDDAFRRGSGPGRELHQRDIVQPDGGAVRRTRRNNCGQRLDGDHHSQFWTGCAHLFEQGHERR